MTDARAPYMPDVPLAILVAGADAVDAGDPMTASTKVRTPTLHTPRCSGSDSDLREWAGRRERMVTCRACGCVTPAPSPAPSRTKTAADARPPLPAAAALGRYRCRDHHSQRVNWRGRGCRLCAQEPRTTRRSRDLLGLDDHVVDADREIEPFDE